MKRKISSYCLLFCLFLSTSAYGRVEWSGRAGLLGQYFPIDVENPPADLQSHGVRLEVVPSLQLSTQSLRFSFKGIAGYDATYKVDRHRTISIPQEFFLEGRTGKWNFLAGLNTFNWGITDIANPLDVLNPRSFRNPVNPVKLGSPSITASWSGDSTSFELVYIPKQFYHELPKNSGRYLPRDATISNYTGEVEGKQMALQTNTEPWIFSYDRPQEYDNVMDSNFGVRLRQTVGKLETHLVGFEGIPVFPEIVPRGNLEIVDLNPPITYQLQRNVDLVPVYARVRTAGIGFVYSWESVILRVVHAQTWRTTNKAILVSTASTYISLPRTTVIGIEKTTNWRKLDWTFLIQGVKEEDLSGRPTGMFSMAGIFDGAIMPGVRIAKGLDYAFLLGGIYNPKSKAQIYSLDSQFRVTDSVQFKLAGQYISGQDNQLLKGLEPASSVEAGFNFFW